MKKPSPYISLIHRLFGLRRVPMTSERAREILDRNRLYSEISYRKPLKEWRQRNA